MQIVTKSARLALLFALLGATATGIARSDERIVGRWVGTHEMEEGEDVEPLELEFVMRDGELRGSMCFPRRGLRNWPLEDLEAGDRGIRAYYGGRSNRTEIDLAIDEGQLHGEIRYPSVTTRCAFTRSKEKELPYRIETAALDGGDVTLAATIFLPTQGASTAGVVFVEGSGETNRSFQKFYADYFARRGVACLFYDKRGCGDSTGHWLDVGFEELADDVVTAVDHLASHERVDADRVGLWGISQAGWIMPMAAARTDAIDFMIVVSGGAVSVEREGYWDVEYWFPKRGLSDGDIAEALEFLKFNNHVTRTGEDYEELVERYKALRGKRWVDALAVTPPQLSPVDGRGRMWYRRVMDIDHRPFVAGLSMPVIWFFGDDDNTFPAVEAAGIVRRIGEENERAFTVHMLPGLGHAMELPLPEGALPFRQLSPEYFALMESWMSEHGFMVSDQCDSSSALRRD